MATKCIGYMSSLGRETVGSFGAVTDWRGNEIDRYHVVSRWRTPKSFVSSHQLQLVVRIGGVKGTFYTARSAGPTMAITGKRKSKQSWD